MNYDKITRQCQFHQKINTLDEKTLIYFINLFSSNPAIVKRCQDIHLDLANEKSLTQKLKKLNIAYFDVSDTSIAL